MRPMVTNGVSVVGLSSRRGIILHPAQDVRPSHIPPRLSIPSHSVETPGVHPERVKSRILRAGEKRPSHGEKSLSRQARGGRVRWRTPGEKGSVSADPGWEGKTAGGCNDLKELRMTRVPA